MANQSFIELCNNDIKRLSNRISKQIEHCSSLSDLYDRYADNAWEYPNADDNSERYQNLAYEQRCKEATLSLIKAKLDEITIELAKL
jgi:hypothetical protein